MPETPDLYDLLPYPDVVVPTANPAHFGAVALLLGANPAPPTRILELGCGTGHNTLAIARDWPNAAVTGIDRSARQMEMARAAGADATNLTFLQADILADDLLALPPFDYIICHGVYSWVPPAVQSRILYLTGKLLSPRGAALISFNVLPGWHFKNGLRDILRFHTTGFESLAEKLEQARMYLQLIESGIGYPESWSSLQMRALAQTVLNAPESYLLHEYLCDCNEALLFTTFSGRAAEAGLQYVGDADFGTNVPGAISEETKEILQTIAGTRERYEQHLDFLTNRTFRHAILTRSEAHVTGRFSSSALQRLRFRARENQVENPDALPSALQRLFPAFSTIEDIAQLSGGNLLHTATGILTGIAEDWVEVKMVE